jgi:Cation transporting ATPase, C-terminus
VYQLSALTWMLVAAPAALGIDPHIPGAGPSLHHTLIFNAFVQMQLFNQVNARCIGDEGDVARGLSTAGLFLGVLGAEAVLQAAIVEWGGAAFSTVPLAPEHWALLVREVVRRVPHEALADALLGPAESSAEK